MAKFKVTLATVAYLTTEIEADDEDGALDAAYKMGEELANQMHGDHRYTVSVNEEWDLRDATVEEL